MSKSLGTAVEPLDAAQTFGPDPLRLYLVKEIAFGERRRFHLGAIRGSLQRRSRQQSRQPRQPHRGDGGADIAGPTDRAAADPGRSPAVAPSGVDRIPDGDGRLCARTRAPPRRSASSTPRTNTSPSTEPWALARDPARADALSQVCSTSRKPFGSPRSCCCRSCRDRQRRSCGGSAKHEAGRADPARRCRVAREPASGVIAKADALWPRSERQSSRRVEDDDHEMLTRTRRTYDPAAPPAAGRAQRKTHGARCTAGAGGSPPAAATPAAATTGSRSTTS